MDVKPGECGFEQCVCDDCVAWFRGKPQSGRKHVWRVARCVLAPGHDGLCERDPAALLTSEKPAGPSLLPARFYTDERRRQLGLG